MTSIPSYDSFEEAPAWFCSGSWIDQADYEPPRGAPRFDVTIEKLIPEHDGYCSDSGLDSSEECSYVREVLCASFHLDFFWEREDFNPPEFSYKNGCTCRGGQSGYCNWLTRVRIISIERWPN